MKKTATHHFAAPLIVRALLALTLASATAQTTTFWDGNENTGGGTSWGTSANWEGNVIPPNASDSHVVIDDRNGTGTISVMYINASRTLGSITFDNINGKLASTLNMDTNFNSGSGARTLTLHSGITLQNTDTTVVFRGNNDALTIDLAADNVFSTSPNSVLRINEEVLVTGVGKLTKTGAGTLLLEGTNTYTGGTDVNSGTVQLGRSNVMGTGPVTLGSVGGGDASIVAIYSGYSHANDITVAAGSGGTLTLGITSAANFSTSFTGNLTLNDDLTLFGNSGSAPGMRLRGEITGSNNLTKTGDGRIRIEADNAGYSGTTTISSGILQVGNGGSTGTLGSGSIVNDASLVVNRNNALTLNNPMSGTGTLTQSGTGTTTISGNNSYSGGTIVEAGTLRIGRSNSLGSGTIQIGTTGAGDVVVDNYLAGWTHSNDIQVVAGSSGTRTLAASSTANFSSIFSGDISLGDSLIIDSASAAGFAMRLTGEVSGSGGLTTQGSGTVRLENANTYTGATSVITGALLVSNTSGSATGTGSVTTSAGTTLGGTGTIAPTGTSNVVINGSVEPGLPGVDNGIGRLEFTPVMGSVTFNPGASIIFDIFANGVNDFINFAATGPSLIDFTGLSSASLAIIFDPSYTPALNDTFDLLDWSAASGSGMSGLSQTLLSLPTTGFQPTWGWDLSLFETQGVVSIGTVIPEPSRIAFLITAAGLVALRRRRSGMR